MLPTIQLRKSFHRRNPPAVPPTPAAPPVHVERVRPAAGEPTVATWIFTAPIDDPVAALAGLTIDGNPGLSWDREEDVSIRVNHGAEVTPGMPWANAAAAGGIVTPDGGPLAAGSGIVDE